MKIKFIIIITLFGFLFSSCHGDLDVVQNSEISANSMWKSENDAVSAMYGLNNMFRNTFNTGLMYWGEYRTGLWGEGLTSQTSREQVYQNQIPNDHGYANWADIYTTINLANLVIKYVPNIQFNDINTQNDVLANGYFVRAFCYYWIGRIWGDAPLLLDGFESDQQDNLYPARQSADDVFKQVGSDIDMALELMPTSVTKRNMPSRGSIEMLRADYSLWMYKVRNGGDSYLTTAENAINDVLSNSIYSLDNSFSDIFTNELGQEIIFAWSYIENEYTDGYPSEYLVPSQYVSADAIENPVKVGSHQQWCFYTEDYKALLSENPKDQRTKISFETYFDEPKNATFQWINKFAGTWTNGTRIFDSDIIVYRYADAIFFDAEIKMAKNNIAGAVESLNKIAKRAYGEDDFYSSSMNKNELNEAIVTERMKEFSAEGKLWWDFIRLGVVFQKSPYLVGRENELNVLLWPVAQTSINKNPNITQTPGYDK